MRLAGHDDLGARAEAVRGGQLTRGLGLRVVRAGNAEFDFLKAKARETGNAGMLAELEAIGHPDPMNTAQYFAFTRPLRQYLDDADRAWLAGLRDLTVNAPGLPRRT